MLYSGQVMELYCALKIKSCSGVLFKFQETFNSTAFLDCKNVIDQVTQALQLFVQEPSKNCAPLDFAWYFLLRKI